MKYFSFFPTIKYRFSDGTSRQIVNLFSRPELNIVDDFGFNVKGNIYTIEDGKSPDAISREIYEDPEYFWSILLSNNIIDFYKEWPISYTYWEEELFKTNSEYTFYVPHNIDVKKNDIVVKKKPNSPSLFDVSNYGIISDSDKFLRSFNVNMIVGNINESDEYYILRQNGIGYQIIKPNQTSDTHILKKKVYKLDSLFKFSKLDSLTQKMVFVSPYYSPSDEKLMSDQISDLSEGDGVNTLLYRYMNNQVPSNISVMSFVQNKENEWVFKKNINVIPSSYINQVNTAYGLAIERISG